MIAAIDANPSQNDKFSFQKFDIPTGVFYERITPIGIYNTEWNIVYHMNITTLQNEFTQIEKTVQQLEKMCTSFANDLTPDLNLSEDNFVPKSIHLSRQCGSTFTQIQIMLQNIKEFNIDWFYAAPNKRTKRAPLNIVGSVLRSMFGTLAQEDATMYLQQFQNMAAAGHDRQVQIDQQTTLLKSTMQIISHMNEHNVLLHNKTSQQFETVDSSIQKLKNDMDNYWLNLEVQMQMENLLTFVVTSLTTYHNRQKQFLEAITFGSSSVAATPIILPPATFMDELEFIRNKISGQALRLPLQITRENVATYYQMACTRSRIINDQLIVSMLSMSIPLLSTQQYELIRITSFPHKLSNGLYNFIIPSHEYVAMDAFRRHYISLTNEELQNCIDLRHASEKNELLCMQSSPIFEISPTTNDCTITLMTDENSATKCDIRVSNFTSQFWIRLRQPNQWIGVFPHKQTLYIRCKDTPTFEQVVEGAGIVSMKQDCQIKSGQILIQAQTNYYTETYQRLQPSVDIQGFVNETISESLKIKTKYATIVNTPNMVNFGEIKKLKDLSSNVKELLLKQKIMEDDHKNDKGTLMRTSTPKFQNYWGEQRQTYWQYLLAILILMVLVAIIIILYKHYNTGSYKPADTEMNTFSAGPSVDTNVIESQMIESTV